MSAGVQGAVAASTYASSGVTAEQVAYTGAALDLPEARELRRLVWGRDRPFADAPDPPERLRRVAYATVAAAVGLGHGEASSLPLYGAWRRDAALRRYGRSAEVLGDTLQQRVSPMVLWRRGLRARNFRAPLDVVWESIGGCGLEVADISEVVADLARRGVTGADHLAWSLYYAAEGVTEDERFLAEDDLRWLVGLERMRGYREALVHVRYRRSLRADA